jgi:hypothetical protein
MPSSAIRNIAYDAERERLWVTFVTGRVYAYERVPPEVHGAFASASSKGTFFNRFIRDHYRYQEIMDTG